MKTLLTLMTVVLFFGVSCKKSSGDQTPAKRKPTVVTAAAVTNITRTSAVCGGTCTDSGTDSVTVRGVFYSNIATSPTELTDNTYQTNDGFYSGSFVSTMTPLLPNTKYYVRAYAGSTVGVGYGVVLSFTTLP
jgi:hypothetical protein